MTVHHPTHSWTRLPFENLERLFLGRDADMRTRSGNVQYPTDRVLPKHLAHVCGVDIHSIYDWRRRGITMLSAERIASRLSMHPSEIWPIYHDVIGR